ncbi:hypothetical protein KC717_04485 [Candidatus Dojkabacteria bacterium]|uniref:Uncharacterized protein n=1 Tax=Candidatus Dojkabacteria bacterium TaxID=2099670 RepID=A0A955L988_9BACT|nr:hypothetical protein [Candidatus Dojkabacteria bacterium]
MGSSPTRGIYSSQSGDKWSGFGPIDTSWAHQVMTTKWSSSPENNLLIKQYYLEMMLRDLVISPDPIGPENDFFILSIPSKFAQGETDTILRGFPSIPEIPCPDDLKQQLNPVVHKLKTPMGEYTLYFFTGFRAPKELIFEMIQNHQAKNFLGLLSAQWDRNFEKTKIASAQFPTIQQEESSMTQKLAMNSLKNILLNMFRVYFGPEIVDHPGFT